MHIFLIIFISAVLLVMIVGIIAINISVRQHEARMTSDELAEEEKEIIKFINMW